MTSNIQTFKRIQTVSNRSNTSETRTLKSYFKNAALPPGDPATPCSLVRPQIRELGGGAVLQQVEARFGDFRALREGLLAEDVARAGKVRKKKPWQAILGPEVGLAAVSSCVFTGMHGPACIFWADLTPSSRKGWVSALSRLGGAVGGGVQAWLDGKIAGELGGHTLPALPTLLRFGESKLRYVPSRLRGDGAYACRRMAATAGSASRRAPGWAAPRRCGSAGRCTRHS